MRENFKPVFFVPLLLTILLLFVVSSGCESWRNQPVSSPILVVGVDGIDWDLALPLIAEGRMPTCERLMAAGRYGKLETLVPTDSPVIWTTVATGMPKEAHGILGFANTRQRNNTRLYDNSHRSAAALWNILSDFEKRVCVVGWWMTWPAEPVNGVMVAQTNTMDQIDTSKGRNTWKGMLRPGVAGQVYPAELESQVMATLGEVETELPTLTEEIFGEFEHPLSRLSDRLWSNCRWSFRADQTYARITRRLIAEEEPFDLAMVYFGGSDVAGHRFFRYMKPELYDHPPTAEQIANFRDVIADYYSWLDAEIGRLIDLYPEDVTVIIISDHGMVPVNQDNPFDPDDLPMDVNSAHHREGPPGIFIAAGPYIEPAADAVAPAALQPEDLPTVGSVYDLAPTILAMLRVPLGRDMEGQVLEQIFAEGFQIDSQPRMVKSHTTEEFQINRRNLSRHDPAESARIEQLQNLGYLPQEDE